jgi:hypothetical protein
MKFSSVFRKEELYASCAVLGIPEQNVILLKHSKLKDDPTVRYFKLKDDPTVRYFKLKDDPTVRYFKLKDGPVLVVPY